MNRAISLMIFVLLFACEQKDNKKPESLDTLSTSVEDSAVQIEKNAEAIPENAPEWYENVPQREGYIYVVANARSKRADIAEDKAEHLAHIIMAQKIRNLKNNLQKNGGMQAQNESDNQTQDMMYSIFIKKERIKEGKYWHAFVLLEMKIPEE